MTLPCLLNFSTHPGFPKKFVADMERYSDILKAEIDPQTDILYNGAFILGVPGRRGSGLGKSVRKAAQGDPATPGFLRKAMSDGPNPSPGRAKRPGPARFWTRGGPAKARFRIGLSF